MANFKTVPLSDERYKNIILTIRNGFTHNGVVRQPNDRIATILMLQTNLGLRIGDILSFKMENMYWNGSKYKLDFT